MGAEQSTRKKNFKKIQKSDANHNVTPVNYDGNVHGPAVDLEYAEEVMQDSLDAVDGLLEEDQMSGLPGESLQTREIQERTKVDLPFNQNNATSITRNNIVQDMLFSTEETQHSVTSSSPVSVSQQSTEMPGLHELQGSQNATNGLEWHFDHYKKTILKTCDRTKKYWKKLTNDFEDNRLADQNEPNPELSAEIPKPSAPQLYSNIMFFPDKSKGASPKRYGPKRLGTRMTSSLPEIQENTRTSSENSDADTSIDIENTIDITMTNSDLDDSRRRASSSSEHRVEPCETMSTLNSVSTHVESPTIATHVAYQEQLVFVDDHFSLNAGIIAIGGIADTAQLENGNTDESNGAACINNAAGQQSPPIIPSTAISNGETLPTVVNNVNSSVTNDSIENQLDTGKVGDPIQQAHLPNFDCDGAISVSSTNSRRKQLTFGQAHKLDNPCDMTLQSIEMSSEFLEYCDKCRETKDLCGCMYFCNDTQSFVALSHQGRPQSVLNRDRYCKLYDSDIPWDTFKSKQGVFAGGLKSMKTSILQDNRICLKFNLPFNKGVNPNADNGVVNVQNETNENELASTPVTVDEKMHVKLMDQDVRPSYNAPEICSNIGHFQGRSNSPKASTEESITVSEKCSLSLNAFPLFEREQTSGYTDFTGKLSIMSNGLDDSSDDDDQAVSELETSVNSSIDTTSTIESRIIPSQNNLSELETSVNSSIDTTSTIESRIIPSQNNLTELETSDSYSVDIPAVEPSNEAVMDTSGELPTDINVQEARIIQSNNTTAVSPSVEGVSEASAKSLIGNEIRATPSNRRTTPDSGKSEGIVTPEADEDLPEATAKCSAPPIVIPSSQDSQTSACVTPVSAHTTDPTVTETEGATAPYYPGKFNPDWNNGIYSINGLNYCLRQNSMTAGFPVNVGGQASIEGVGLNCENDVIGRNTDECGIDEPRNTFGANENNGAVIDKIVDEPKDDVSDRGCVNAELTDRVSEKQLLEGQQLNMDVDDKHTLESPLMKNTDIPTVDVMHHFAESEIEANTTTNILKWLKKKSTRPEEDNRLVIQKEELLIKKDMIAKVRVEISKISGKVTDLAETNDSSVTELSSSAVTLDRMHNTSDSSRTSSIEPSSWNSQITGQDTNNSTTRKIQDSRELLGFQGRQSTSETVQSNTRNSQTQDSGTEAVIEPSLRNNSQHTDVQTQHVDTETAEPSSIYVSRDLLRPPPASGPAHSSLSQMIHDAVRRRLGGLGSNGLHPLGNQRGRVPVVPETATSDFALSLWESAEQGLQMSVQSSQSSSICSSSSSEFDSTESSPAIGDVTGNVVDADKGLDEAAGFGNQAEDGELMAASGDDNEAPDKTEQSASSNEETDSLKCSSCCNMRDSETADLTPWQEYMDSKLKKCKQVKGVPHSCRATVLCVDASQNMIGLPWQQTTAYIFKFLDDLQRIKDEYKIEEYVALVVFGYETTVKVELTTNYTLLRRTLETITPGGPCCMLPGLALALYCMVPFQGRHYAQVHQVVMENRAILYSTGYPTDWQSSFPSQLWTGTHLSLPSGTATPFDHLHLQSESTIPTERPQNDLTLNLESVSSEVNSSIEVTCLPKQIAIGHQQTTADGQHLKTPKLENLSADVSLPSEAHNNPTITLGSGTSGSGTSDLETETLASSMDYMVIQELASSVHEWCWDKVKTQLHYVPVGNNPNMVCFEALSSATNGKIHSKDAEQLSSNTHNHYVSSQICNQMFEAMEEFDKTMFMSLLHVLFPDKDKLDRDEILTIAEEAHAEYIVGKNERKDNSTDWRTCQDGLPPLGSRVIQGPDLLDIERDCVSERGTVIEHHFTEKGNVFIRWDNGYEAVHAIGSRGKYGVLPEDVNTPCKVTDKVKVGYTVRRGPDWEHENQDGGGDQVGRVVRLCRNLSVMVRWPNNNICNYRCGFGGKYDVVVSDPLDPLGRETFVTEMNKRNDKKTNTKNR